MHMQYGCLQHAHERANGYPTRSVGLRWGLALALFTLTATLTRADPEGLPRDAPREFTPMACYQLVQDAGRMIAWARWEQGMAFETVRAAELRRNKPAWMIDLVQGWIADAYEWRATDEQVLQWARELGNAEDLPHADRLTVSETIAIWMRRIARQCAAQPHA